MIELAIFVSLFAMIVVNLIYVLGFPLWWSALVVGVGLTAIFSLRRGGDAKSLARRVLSPLNVMLLSAVALVLAGQAWLALRGAAGVSVGHLLPLFIAAIALYIQQLWIGGVVAEHQRPKEVLTELIGAAPLLSTLCTALIVSAYGLLSMDYLRDELGVLDSVTRRFLERGVIPPLTLLLFCWGALLLLGKLGGSWYLRRVLEGRWMNLEVAARLRWNLDQLHFDGDSLNESLQLLWRRLEESYLIPRYISWAVPILGFIGTVLGISLAADGIRRIIESTEGLSALSSDLGQAIAPLGIAFDTTLIALSLSVVLTLLLTLVQRSEEHTLLRLEEQLRERSRAG